MTATPLVESISARCSRVRAAVTLEQFFEKMNWDYPDRERIRCVWPSHADENPSMAVYEARQTVHCFACGKGGDVIELTRFCASGDSTTWRVEAALDWLESTFGLSNVMSPSGLRQRMAQRLGHWKKKAARAVAEPVTVADQEVARAFADVERGVNSGDLAFGGSIKDYVYEVGYSLLDPLEWAAWARRMVYGPYAAQLQFGRALRPPATIIDDRPEAIRLRHLWDAHRSSDLPPLATHE